MDTEMKNAIQATDQESQYDEKVKRLLGHKHILAHILVKAVKEFSGMEPNDVVQYIEGEPYIGKVPTEPGLTNIASNKTGERIVGFNSENQEINEGLVRFDIVFYVRMKDGPAQIIVNVEAQKDVPSEYKLLNRAVFYVCRLISSQKERDFVNTKYDDIKRVYSIWICLNMKESSMEYVHLTKEKLLGEYEWEGGTELLNIVVIGLSNELPEHNEEYELHRLLGALLSMELNVEEKLNIIEKEYEMPVEARMREEVNSMCNLGEGIREKALAEGTAKGLREGTAKGLAEGTAKGLLKGRNEEKSSLILKMYRKKYPLQEIAELVGKSIEEVQEVIESQKPLLS